MIESIDDITDETDNGGINTTDNSDNNSDKTNNTSIKPTILGEYIFRIWNYLFIYNDVQVNCNILSVHYIL